MILCRHLFTGMVLFACPIVAEASPVQTVLRPGVEDYATRVTLDEMVGKDTFMRGVRRGLHEALLQAASSGCGRKIEEAHSGYFAALEEARFAFIKSLVDANYASFRDAAAIKAKQIADDQQTRRVADFIMSESGRRFSAAWEDDSETDFLLFWKKYRASLGNDADLEELSSFEASSAFAVTKTLNQKLGELMQTWSILWMTENDRRIETVKPVGFADITTLRKSVCGRL